MLAEFRIASFQILNLEREERRSHGDYESHSDLAVAIGFSDLMSAVGGNQTCMAQRVIRVR
jgi:hypothetical protein